MKEQVPAWTRPETSVSPRIWIRKGGYVVRDVSADLDDFVVEHMRENYAWDSPTLGSIGIANDAPSMDELACIWKYLQLPQRLSLVLLEEGTPGADLQPVDNANPPIVLGASILTATHRTDKQLPMNVIANGPLLKKMYAAKKIFIGAIDVFERFGVDCVLDTFGMSVARNLRGNGLGRMLLEGRLEMCRGLSIPLTKSIFTSKASQILAGKIGYSIIKELPFSDLLDEDGNVIYGDLNNTIQLCVFTL